MQNMTTSKNTEAAAIIGGFENCAGGLLDAQDWIESKMDATLVEDVEWYVKGDHFTGILFAKFGDVSKRDKFIDNFPRSNLLCDGIKVWSNIDKPVEDRVPERFFNGVRKQLGEWGEIDKRSIRVEMEGPSKKLIIGGRGKVGGVTVGTGVVLEGKF